MEQVRNRFDTGELACPQFLRRTHRRLLRLSIHHRQTTKAEFCSTARTVAIAASDRDRVCRCRISCSRCCGQRNLCAGALADTWAAASRFETTSLPLGHGWHSGQRYRDAATTSLKRVCRSRLSAPAHAGVPAHRGDRSARAYWYTANVPASIAACALSQCTERATVSMRNSSTLPVR